VLGSSACPGDAGDLAGGTLVRVTDDGSRPPGAEAERASRLLGPAEVRSLARRLGLRPTKRLGQNFVHDPNTVRRIVRSADVAADDVVLEVGPGLGSLTLALLPAVARVHAVEIDPVLAAQLPLTVAERAPELAGRLDVTALDALRLRAGDLPDGSPTALVANLPYNVAVPVVLHLLAELPELRRGLVMVQAEVAERLAAPPGGRAYGAPSAKLAWYAAARRAGAVPRTVFWPVPNVDSGLLAFERREPPAEAGRDEVFALVDAAFAQRRKALRAGLAGWAGSPAAAEEALLATGIAPLARAETLGIGEFARLAAARPGPPA
jgi:16S rRNA (adenine1518-N6/adenine1519-N6)-dimethyltransferase